MNTNVGVLLRSLFAAAAVLSIAGCRHHPRHPHGGPPGRHHVSPPVVHRPVVVAPTRVHVAEPARHEPDHSHACHDACDHHWDGVRFVVSVGHRHGHGCGHARSGNRWVVARVVVNPGNNGRGNGRGRR